MTTKNEPLPSTQHITHNVDEHYGLTVRITVGKGKKARSFDIHRGVLQFYSGYFRTAIKNVEEGKFAEGINGMCVITLPEDDQETFTLFRRWLYAPNRRMTASGEVGAEYGYLSYDALAKLWCFAAQRVIPMLQNRVIDLIIAKMASSEKMSTSTIRYVFTEASADSPLRRLVVYYNAHGQRLEAGDDLKKKEIASETWFAQFCTEISVERFTGKPPNTPNYTSYGYVEPWSRCPYHVHEKGAKCNSKGWNAS